MESELIIDGQAVSLPENQESAQEATTEQQDENREEQVHEETEQSEEKSEGEQAEEQPDYSVKIGDEEVAEREDDEQIDGKPAPQWIKELRKGFKDTQKENRDLKRQLEEIQAKPVEQQAQSSEVIPNKPTLESCEYDEARYEQAVTDWHEKKAHTVQVQQQQQAQQQEYQHRYQQRLAAHKERAEKFPLKDYAEMEEVARNEVSNLHQEILIHAADDGSELIAYALGKSPKLRQRLAAEKDPIRAAYMLGQISKEVSLAPRVKPTPKPEPEVRGGGGNAKIDEFSKQCPGAKIE